MTPELFTSRILSLSDQNEYKFIEEYKQYREKIKCVHLICNTEFAVKPHAFLIQSTRCPTCSKQGRTKRSTVQIQKEIDQLTNSTYQLIDDYSSINLPMKIKHNECGTIQNIQYQNFKGNGQRCYKCTMERNNERSRLTFDDINDKIKKVHGDEYIAHDISDYRNIHSSVYIKHNICNNVFQMQIHNLCINKRTCTFCQTKQSGEDKIVEILTENNIYFEREKIFKELGRLRFDFFLPEYNTLIEYDGIQHFKPIDFFGGESQLEYVQSNDSKKNQFCTDNNIRLVRIRYDEPIDSKVLEIFNKTK